MGKLAIFRIIFDDIWFTFGKKYGYYTLLRVVFFSWSGFVYRHTLNSLSYPSFQLTSQNSVTHISSFFVLKLPTQRIYFLTFQMVLVFIFIAIIIKIYTISPRKYDIYLVFIYFFNFGTRRRRRRENIIIWSRYNIIVLNKHIVVYRRY